MAIAFDRHRAPPLALALEWPSLSSLMSKESPCIAVCMIDPGSGLCYGCGRTLQEIASWHRLESAERQAVMAGLAQRMTEAGLVPPGDSEVG